MKKLYMTLAAALLAAPAVMAQDCLYLVGQPSGWMEPSEANASAYEAWKLPAVEEGVLVYDAKFEVNAGEFMLRFYSALDGWDQSSIGIQGNDDPVDFVFTDCEFVGQCMPGKGSWNNPDWAGGEVRFVVDLYANRVTFLYGEEIDKEVPYEVVDNGGAYTIYVQNETGWENLYMYMWGDVNDLGAVWPGLLPSDTKVIAGYTYLCYSLGEEATGLTENLIFNDGNGTQLNDYQVTINKDYYLKVTTEGVVNLEGDDEPTEKPTPSGDNHLYIVGNFEGWNIDESAYPLYELSEGVYVSAYDVANADGFLQFRFYKVLGDWETNSVGSQENDDPIDIVLNDGMYEGPCVDGKGTWKFDWAGGNLTFKVDLNDMTVTFSEGVSEEAAGVKGISAANLNLRYNHGVISAEEATDFVVINMAGQVVARSFGESIDLNNLGKGVYAVSANGNVLKVVR